MIRSIVLLTLVPTLAGMLIAASASASPPSAANSSSPAAIRLVGANGTTPDATAGQFTIVVRGLSNNPIPSALVSIDFSQCPDIELCTDQSDANETVTCAGKLVRKITNTSGAVQFVILGSSHGPADASMALERVRVFANGVLIGEPAPSAFDLDGSSGVGADDLSAWLTDFGSGLNTTRADYDGDGTVGAADLSEWLTGFGAGGSTQSCATSCP
jgi:hypothetical protein